MTFRQTTQEIIFAGTRVTFHAAALDCIGRRGPTGRHSKQYTRGLVVDL